ncbi:MAG: TonB-dependent receptor [Bryobacterales bacterium]|nr:TonB-dependent receptor [Bryobacterales bacterium]
MATFQNIATRVASAALFVALAMPLPAQTTLGTIRGLATDASGAIVPGVQVTVRNTGTNLTRQTLTGLTGNYEVTQLTPGRYEVTAEKAGFKKVVVSDILLETSATVRADLSMEVGELASAINVQASAPVINTESAEIAQVRSNAVIEKMPMNVRGQFDGFYFELLTFTPGATRGQGSNFSLAGARGNQWGATVDGTSQRSPLFANSIGPAQSNMEMTGEIRIQLANDKAEAGLPGGVYASSKSGTNEYHGSLFWYHSNSRLQARNTFSTSVPFQILNDYGGSIGGPIRRNRTFFFTTYERFPLRNEAIFNSNLPTAAFRSGDFSSLLPATAIRDPLTGSPFPGNIIPTNRLSQSALAIQEQFYPLPNFGPANNWQQNWRGTRASSQYKTQVEARIDHQVSNANTLFGRISWNRTGANVWDYSLVTIPKREQDRRSTTITISDNHIFSPNLINEFRFGIMRTENPAFNPLDGPALIKKFGLQGISWNPELDKGAPVFSFNNFEEIGATDLYQDPSERIHQVVNNVTWTRNNHVIKSGVEIRWNRGTNFPGGTSFPVLQFGQFSFSGAFSNFDYADFLLGVPTTAGRASAAPLINSINTDAALFVQDDWKITPRLTLNLGLRYEYNPPYHEKDDNFFNFDAATGRLILPSRAALERVNPLFPTNLVPIVTAEEAGLPKSLWYTDLNNFMPRFGFAYRATASGRTVIRGGYGIYVDDLTSSLWRLGTGGPFISRETFDNTITNGVPRFQFPNAFPPGFGAIGAQSFSAINPKLRNPYIQQWNLTLEQEVANVGFRISYIGTNTRKLIWVQNINQPAPSATPFSSSLRRFPNLRDIGVRDNGATHNYHSLHITGERKLQNGLYYQLGWTLAKNLTDCQSDSEGGCQPQNAYARHLEYSNVSYTNRHRVTGTLLYDLPFGRGKPFFTGAGGPANWIVGGWTVSAVLVAQTGLFFSPSFSGFDVSNTGSTGTQRPDRIANGNLPGSERTIDRWFDRTAFVVPGDRNGDGRPDGNPGRFGNAAPNTIEGPRAVVLDAGLHKQFQFTERFRAMLEGTFTNVLNHPNYGSPNTNIRSGAVGTIRNLYNRYGAGPRGGRVALRIEF